MATMVELKVYVDGIQRVVCGVNDSTSCQDVIIALAQATGQTGRFKLVEKSSQTNEKRTLKPHEKPLHVMSKWNQTSNDVFFMLLTVGDTPSNSRPPSSIGLPLERFRQPGDGSDLSEFPKQRQASIRRSMTFNGYKTGSITSVKELKDKVNEKAEKLCYELTDLIDTQKRRLTQQQGELESMDLEIIGLSHVENGTAPVLKDEEMEAIERTMQANKSAIEEVEYWEHELDIECQLQTELLKMVSVLRDKVTLCEESIRLRQKEAKQILEQMERESGRQKRVAEERLQRDLDAVQGEVKLLEEEYEGYSANLDETNLFLEEIETVYEEKFRKVQRLEIEINPEDDVKKTKLKVPLAVIDIDGQLSEAELKAPSPSHPAHDVTSTQQQQQHSNEQQDCKYYF